MVSPARKKKDDWRGMEEEKVTHKNQLPLLGSGWSVYREVQTTMAIKEKKKKRKRRIIEEKRE